MFPADVAVGVTALCANCGEPITVVNFHEHSPSVWPIDDGTLAWVHIGNLYTDGVRYFICGNVKQSEPIDLNRMAEPR